MRKETPNVRYVQSFKTTGWPGAWEAINTGQTRRNYVQGKVWRDTGRRKVLIA